MPSDSPIRLNSIPPDEIWVTRLTTLIRTSSGVPNTFPARPGLTAVAAGQPAVAYRAGGREAARFVCARCPIVAPLSGVPVVEIT